MNSTFETQSLSDKLVKERLFHTVVVILLFFIGITGNSAVLLIFMIKIRCDRPSRYLIAVLAGFDIIACTNGSIFSILRNSYRAEFPSDMLCKFLFYITSAMTLISALILMLISIVRYRKICHIGRSETSLRCQTILFVVTSLIAVFVTIPMYLFYGVREYNLQHRNETLVVKSCTTLEINEDMIKVKLLYFAFILLILLVVLIVMAVLYGKIGHVIFTKFRKTAKIKESFSKTTPSTDISENCTVESSRLEEDTNRTKRKKKIETRMRTNITLMLMVVTVLFVITYLPAFAFLIIPGNNPDEFWMSLPVVKLNAYLMLSRMYLFSHALNPLVYLYFDRTFRQALTDFCHTLARGK